MTRQRRPIVVGGLALVAAFVGGNIGAVNAVADGVEIPDPKLAQELRSALGLPDNSPIGGGQLAGLDKLDISGSGVTQLTGLEHATGLSELVVDGNEIVDVSPLSSLNNLRVLEMQENRVADISPLAGLAKIEHLAISGNEISDLGPLAGLPRLSELLASDNQIADLGPLANLNSLKVLNLSSNKIEDLSALENLSALTDLYAAENQIADVRPISQLSELEQLVLESNRIADVSALANMPKLNNLLLGGNKIADVNPLLGIASLRSLQLDNNNISSLEDLAQFQQLHSLGVARNKISDISPLGALVNLRSLNVSHNELSSLAPVGEMVSLEQLLAQDNMITSLPNLSQLQALKDLYVSDNKLEDISGVSELQKLRIFDARSNRIKDISPLADLQGLLFVNVQGNQISDLSPIGAAKINIDASGQQVDTGQLELLNEGSVVSVPLPNLRLVADRFESYQVAAHEGLRAEIVDGKLQVECLQAGCVKENEEKILASWRVPGSNFSGDVVVRFVAAAKPTIFERVHGRNRVATSLAALGAGEYDSATVLLASGNSFADAIAAAPLAAAENAPIVLTGGKKLERDILDTLRREGYRRVVIVGGPGSVSPAVSDELLANGFLVTWAAGRDRAETAVRLAELASVHTAPERIFLVDGQQFPDGLAAGAVTERAKAVIVLSAGDKLPEVTKRFLADHANVPVVAIGGKARTALESSSHDPLLREAVFGPNRYATAIAVADAYARDATEVVVSSGADFPDVLAGGALAAQRRGVVLLTPPASLSPFTKQWLEMHRPQRLTILGGPGSVFPAVEESLRETLR